VTRRRYSDEERAEILAALDANGGDIRATARATGVPYTTLREWVITKPHDDVTKLRSEKKIDLAARLEEVAWKLTGELLSDKKLQGATYQQIATSMGITIDKMQLLRGAPTSIADIAIEQLAQRIQDMSDDERNTLAAQLGESNTTQANT
jgi:hypothetical protein